MNIKNERTPSRPSKPLDYGPFYHGTDYLLHLFKMLPNFTRSAIDGLKRTVKGAPIIVDDLTQTRYNQHAIETIKKDDFGVVENIVGYPACRVS